METTFNERFTKLWSTTNFRNPTDAERKIGIKRQSIIEFTKDAVPTYDTLVKLLNYFKHIDARWLITGEGDMITRPSHVNEDSPDYSSAIVKKIWQEDRAELIQLRIDNRELMAEIKALRERLSN